MQLISDGEEDYKLKEKDIAIELRIKRVANNYARTK